MSNKSFFSPAWGAMIVAEPDSRGHGQDLCHTLLCMQFAGKLYQELDHFVEARLHIAVFGKCK